MEAVTDVRKETVSKARADAIVKPQTARLYYLDTIRAILIALVIALHTAITYGAMGDWAYEDPFQTELSGILLTFVTTIVQAFSLGLYFFIAGYFTPGSYDRKGIGQFWKDRMLRLGIPMIVYAFVLSRVPNYVAAVASGMTIPYWKFASQNFITEADGGPTWFIAALLLFSLGYTLWRLATRSLKMDSIRSLQVPGKKKILGFGVGIAVLMFIVGLASPINETVEFLGTFSFMTIFFVQYILCFVAGTWAYRGDWLGRLEGKDKRFWLFLTIGLLLTMPVMFFAGGAAAGTVDVFVGGMYWQSAVFMLWIGLFSVSISMSLILWLRDRKGKRSSVMAFAGPNSYAVYLIHPLIQVPFTYAFSFVPMDPLLKYVIAVPVVVVLCFLAAGALRRIPGVKTIL